MFLPKEDVLVLDEWKGTMWNAMNPPVEPDGQAYVEYHKGKRYLVCPFCGKKNLLLKETTTINDLRMKCKDSYCKKFFEVNI